MRSLKRKIEVTVEKTNTGYSAFADEMDVFSTAENIPALYHNLLEALNLAFEDEGYVVSVENLKLNLDLKQFFQFYRVLNASFLAERIGMNPTLLSQYIRGKKKPSAKQTNRIIKGIQTIGKELSELNLV